MLKLLFSLFFLLPFSVSAYTLDQFYDAGDDTDSDMYYNRVQTFTPAISGDVDYVNVLAKTISCSGTIRFDIRTTSGGTPSTASGSLGVSPVYQCADFSGSATWATVTFNGIPVTASTKYGLSASTSPDQDYYWRVDASSATYSGGSYWYSIDGGATFIEESTRDALFRVYVTEPASEPEPDATSTGMWSTTTPYCFGSDFNASDTPCYYEMSYFDSMTVYMVIIFLLSLLTAGFFYSMILKVQA